MNLQREWADQLHHTQEDDQPTTSDESTVWGRPPTINPHQIVFASRSGRYHRGGKPSFLPTRRSPLSLGRRFIWQTCQLWSSSASTCRNYRGRVPRGARAAGVAVLVAVLAGFNTLYQVQPEEVGVVLRFGRYARTTEPGLRAKIQFVEQVNKAPVQRQLK